MLSEPSIQDPYQCAGCASASYWDPTLPSRLGGRSAVQTHGWKMDMNIWQVHTFDVRLMLSGVENYEALSIEGRSSM